MRNACPFGVLVQFMSWYDLRLALNGFWHGGPVRVGFPCILLAHQTLVGIRTNVDEIWSGRVRICQLATVVLGVL